MVCGNSKLQAWSADECEVACFNDINLHISSRDIRLGLWGPRVFPHKWSWCQWTLEGGFFTSAFSWEFFFSFLFSLEFSVPGRLRGCEGKVGIYDGASSSPTLDPQAGASLRALPAPPWKAQSLNRNHPWYPRNMCTGGWSSSKPLREATGQEEGLESWEKYGSMENIKMGAAHHICLLNIADDIAKQFGKGQMI